MDVLFYVIFSAALTAGFIILLNWANAQDRQHPHERLGKRARKGIDAAFEELIKPLRKRRD